MGIDFSGLNHLDIAIAALFAGSILLSLFRGFTKELLSLIGWVVAIIAARQFTPMGAEWLQENTSMQRAVSTGAAAILIIIVCRLLFGLITAVVRKFLEAVRLSLLDRILGTVFGALRAVLIVLLCMMIGKEVSQIQQSELWKDSQLLPKFTVLDKWFSEFMSTIWQHPEEAVEEAVEEVKKGAEKAVEKAVEQAVEKAVEHAAEKGEAAVNSIIE